MIRQAFISEAVPKFVLIRGVVYPGHEKAPFVPSGKGLRGCVSYNPEKDLLQCHECGEWFENLAAHVRSDKHDISVREYKERHYLRLSTSLVNRRIQKSLAAKCRPANREGMLQAAALGREAMYRAPKVPGSRRRSLYELRNEQGTCHAQLIGRIGEIVKEFGKTPSADEFAERGIHVYTLLDSFNVKSLPELMDKLGYGRHQWDRTKIPDAVLLDALRDFYVARGRLPKEAEWGNGALASQGTYCKRFGSTAKAYKQAGLALVAGGALGFRFRVSTEAIFTALQEFHQLHGRIPRHKEFGTAELPFEPCLLRNRFGSMKAAFEAAGINISEADERRLRQGRWNRTLTRQDVKESFLNYCEAHDGNPPSREEIQAGALGISAPVVYKHFGTLRPDRLLRQMVSEPLSVGA